MKENFKNALKINITKDQCKDAGMAFVLLTMILDFVFANVYCLIFGIALLIITMCAPIILKPAAHLWFGMAQLLGTYVSKLILLIVYYAVVTPVGLLRRLLKKDALKLKEFKMDVKSVMADRNVTYKPVDIVKPF